MSVKKEDKDKEKTTKVVKRLIKAFLYTCPGMEGKNGADVSPLTNGRRIK